MITLFLLYFLSDASDVKISWTKNGEIVKKTKKLKLLNEGNTVVLIVPKATADDTGDYRVTVVNAAGTVEANITVMVEKEDEKKKKKKKDLKVGMKTEVEEEKTEEDGLKVAVSTQEEQEAAKDGELKVDMKQTVEKLPVFEEKPEPSSVSVGENIKLQCKVSGINFL